MGKIEEFHPKPTLRRCVKERNIMEYDAPHPKEEEMALKDLNNILRQMMDTWRVSKASDITVVEVFIELIIARAKAVIEAREYKANADKNLESELYRMRSVWDGSWANEGASKEQKEGNAQAHKEELSENIQRILIDGWPVNDYVRSLTARFVNSHLDSFLGAVHRYDRNIGADHIGVALKREEGESASSYLSRCLYPEYRKLFYESNDYIREKEFEKICGDQDEYIARYVETHIKGYDRNRPAIENWGRMLARHFMGMGIKMKMESLPRWKKIPEGSLYKSGLMNNPNLIYWDCYYIDKEELFNALEKEE